jgi:uncharacterized protein YcfJ
MTDDCVVLHRCPHCGSCNTDQVHSGAQIGMMIGGVLGAAYATKKIIDDPLPVLATSLIAGCVLGLLWGSETGQIIGSFVDKAMPNYRCFDCDKEFTP